MKNKKVLGIDFGTSNTYFSESFGNVNPVYEDLKFHNSESTVPSCILYKKENGITHPIEFGQAAIDLWAELEEEERSSYSFASSFKPDIAHSKRSYQHAVAFFKCIKNYFQKEGLNYFDFSEERKIVVGIPAKNIEGQKAKTQNVFRDAGIPNPILIAEPQGALYYHLLHDRQKLTLEKAYNGVIVIDFGGGTLDVAYLKNCHVKNVWGNPLIGGRLLDDIFFQWFLEKQNNPGLLKEIKDDGNLQSIMTVACCNLKERFSNAWNRDGIERFRDRISIGIDYDYGIFKKVSVDDFYQKARNYHMSPELLDILELVNDPMLDSFKNGESINLIEAIKQEIRPQDIQEKDVSVIILTGGSSRWPFMKDIAKELFPYADIFCSNNPEATISRGLGAKIIMDYRTQVISARLHNAQDTLVKNVVAIICENYKHFTLAITQKFENDFFELKIKSFLTTWRKEGGSLESLEKEAERISNDYFSYDAKQVIEKQQENLRIDIQKAINNNIEMWLKDNEIEHIEYLDIHLGNFDKNMQNVGGVDNIINSIFTSIELFVAAIVGVVTASILGGAGTALLMSGPFGLIIGFILGASGAIVALSKVNTKQIHLPAFILKNILTDNQIDKAKAKFKEEIEEKMKEAFEETKDDLEKKINTEIAFFTKEVIKKISVTAILKN